MLYSLINSYLLCLQNINYDLPEKMKDVFAINEKSLIYG